ncbi:unnamed protein product [Amoebophrya sp. A25]|nr:unnamed protein product [Amoebophrya sp. A25]|eukprot:GSA25T00005598001.1
MPSGSRTRRAAASACCTMVLACAIIEIIIHTFAYVSNLLIFKTVTSLPKMTKGGPARTVGPDYLELMRFGYKAPFFTTLCRLV